MQLQPWPSGFKGLSHLAARLGVMPSGTSNPGTLLVASPDGLYYDVFQLVEAVLDTLDTAAGRLNPP